MLAVQGCFRILFTSNIALEERGWQSKGVERRKVSILVKRTKKKMESTSGRRFSWRRGCTSLKITSCLPTKKLPPKNSGHSRKDISGVRALCPSPTFCVRMAAGVRVWDGLGVSWYFQFPNFGVACNPQASCEIFFLHEIARGKKKKQPEIIFLLCLGWNEATSSSVWLGNSGGVAAIAGFTGKKGNHSPCVSIQELEFIIRGRNALT